MLRTINLSGYTFTIDEQELYLEFRRKYSERFKLMDLKVVNDTMYFPDSDSQIIGRCTPHTVSTDTLGLNVSIIDFTNQCFYFSLSPHSFKCIEDKLKLEILASR